jgi:hypothetical protein
MRGGVIALSMEPATRRSRIHRTRTGKRIEITSRDIEIFRALARYRYLRSTARSRTLLICILPNCASILARCLRCRAVVDGLITELVFADIDLFLGA